ncbi:hypothetical protein [Streptomyces sp. XY431]|uniref:DUF7144 family membrane protein n=1 Tax=Streptomyces sp. XY431 TaxID=1415562 RepID=UPI00099BB49F|nr:hypothetical protein [Streptomyces sp. XY431]
MSSTTPPTPPTPPPSGATPPPGQGARPAGPATPPPRHGASGWVTGGVLFAGVLMMMNGVLDVTRGIMAIAEDDVFVTTRNYVFQFSLTGWGWIHLIIGALIAVTGFFVVRGAVWAQYVGIGLVVLGGIESFLSLPYYPIWSVVVLALDVFIIWALCTNAQDRG